MNQDLLELTQLAQLQEKVLGGKGLGYLGEFQDSGGFDSPWLAQPPGSLPFPPYPGVVAVPAVGSSSTVLTVTVPLGYDGVIKRLSINYTGGGFVSGSGDLVFRLNADGRPMKNMSNLTSELGSTTIPYPIDNIRVYEGQVITITVTHVANAALGANVIAFIGGYFYPRGGN